MDYTIKSVLSIKKSCVRKAAVESTCLPAVNQEHFGRFVLSLFRPFVDYVFIFVSCPFKPVIVHSWVPRDIHLKEKTDNLKKTPAWETVQGIHQNIIVQRNFGPKEST